MQAASYSAQDAFIWCCRLWTYTCLSHCWLSRHSGPWEHIESLSNTILTSSNALLATAAKSLQSCPTLCDPIDGSPPGSPCPWDSPGKNTGESCHFLLQCMKVKSESEVLQSCPTLCDPMDCSLPGSSAHGTFQARVLEWGAIAFHIFRPSLSLTETVTISS